MQNRLYLVTFLLLFSSFKLHGQSESRATKATFLPIRATDEIHLSGTKLDFSDFTRSLGFGFGVRVQTRFGNIGSVLIGLEYNETSRFLDFYDCSTDRSRFWNSRMKIPSISLPIELRIMLSRTRKIFAIGGVFLDRNFSSIHSGGTRENHRHFTGWRSFDNESSTCHASDPINVGFSFGFGKRIELRKFALVPRFDYKYGLQVEPHNNYFRFSIAFAGGMKRFFKRIDSKGPIRD